MPVLIFAFLMAFLANAIYLEAILGEFAAEVFLDATDCCKQLDQKIIPIADILVTIFFVLVSAKADLGVLNPFLYLIKK